jgi:hypothetical protein
MRTQVRGRLVPGVSSEEPDPSRSLHLSGSSLYAHRANSRPREQGPGNTRSLVRTSLRPSSECCGSRDLSRYLIEDDGILRCSVKPSFGVSKSAGRRHAFAGQEN